MDVVLYQQSFIIVFLKSHGKRVTFPLEFFQIINTNKQKPKFKSYNIGSLFKVKIKSKNGKT